MKKQTMKNQTAEKQTTENQTTELVFILDKSGSMASIVSDTIGGFNSMLEEQKTKEGLCHITTVLFDNQSVLLHDRIDIRAVNPITKNEYRVGGATALLDAIGSSIHKISSVQKQTSKKYRAQNVMFVIITDGEENASRNFNYSQIKEMVEHQKEKYNWEFIFLGANIDAVEVAGHFGIRPNRAQNFHADSKGMQVNFDALNETVLNYRACACVSPDWDESISEDFNKRL
ncbi:MAG: vWA domain-containing protein [Clostridia bacterium]